MSVRVLEAGISDTLQDNGRYGYSAMGINPGGVMDPVAAAAANYLVDNDDHGAVMELHFPAATLRFEVPVLLAITGADFLPCIDDNAVPVNTPLLVHAGAVLDFTKMRNGARAYIAVHGGFKGKPWLGSYSTNTKARAGGHEGRPLQKGDVISCSAFGAHTKVQCLPWHADVAGEYTNPDIIRIVKGTEYDVMTECSATIVEGNTFRISPQSDRMGFRLNGSPLRLQTERQMISSAVSRGTIQLLPDGQLIILMADHQATGGYPRVGHVISADIPRLAQMPVHTAMRFELTTLDEAEMLLLRQHHHLQQLKNACTFRLQEFLQQHAAHRS